MLWEKRAILKKDADVQQVVNFLIKNLKTKLPKLYIFISGLILQLQNE